MLFSCFFIDKKMSRFPDHISLFDLVDNIYVDICIYLSISFLLVSTSMSSTEPVVKGVLWDSFKSNDHTSPLNWGGWKL